MRLIDVEKIRSERKAAVRKWKKRKAEREEPKDKTVDDPRYVWAEGIGTVLVKGDEEA